ncbi:hypothetical protein BDDG_13440, partial [Blastomyces dermatitidis ATCC 18188]
SSHINRSVFTDDSELNVKSLIKNLKNMIMKKLSVLYIIRSFISSSTLSVSFSATFSQSSTPVSVSDSLTLTTSISVTLTAATSDFTVSAFVISSSHFKKMLYRLNKSHLSRIISFLNSVKIIKDICVFRNRNMNVVLFYTHRCETFASVSEIILIKDDNVTETTLFYSQASSVAFSPFSVKKVVHTSDC